MTCGVYKITNVVNGKIYVGSSSNIEKRWRSHVQQANKVKPRFLLGRAIKKYGPDRFMLLVLEQTKPEDRATREQFYIDSFQPFGDRGYNICKVAGTTVGLKWSEEHRQKMQAKHRSMGTGTWNKGRTAWNKNQSHTDETKAKIRATKMGRHIGPNNWKSKPSVFRSPNGELVEFASINSGCKERGLHVGHMARVARGLARTHKGWTLPSRDEIESLNTQNQGRTGP